VWGERIEGGRRRIAILINITVIITVMVMVTVIVIEIIK
jgi:hypothetical protein